MFAFFKDGIMAGLTVEIHPFKAGGDKAEAYVIVTVVPPSFSGKSLLA